MSESGSWWPSDPCSVLTLSATSLLGDQKFRQEVSRGSSALSEYASDFGGALCECLVAAADNWSLDPLGTLRPQKLALGFMPCLLISDFISHLHSGTWPAPTFCFLPRCSFEPL